MVFAGLLKTFRFGGADAHSSSEVVSDSQGLGTPLDKLNTTPNLSMDAQQSLAPLSPISPTSPEFEPDRAADDRLRKFHRSPDGKVNGDLLVNSSTQLPMIALSLHPSDSGFTQSSGRKSTETRGSGGGRKSSEIRLLDRTNASSPSPIDIKRTAASPQPPSNLHSMSNTTPVHLMGSMNPLAQVILKRVETESTASPQLDQAALPASSGSPVSPAVVGSNIDRKGSLVMRASSTGPSGPGASSVSSNSSSGHRFLSRLLHPSSARPTTSDENDPTQARRDEGWKADVYYYVPNYPTPPKYIKVRVHRKSQRELGRLFLAQEIRTDGRPAAAATDSASQVNSGDGASLRSHSSSDEHAIWCGQFSMDGRYFAAAGEDKVVRVWRVISFESERSYSTSDEELAEDDEGLAKLKHAFRRDKKSAYAPVFDPVPIREFGGHTADVLDVSWSKNNFLLSSSMDKSVRLWHVERSTCLGTYMHPDFVTSIRFHPKDDRFFLSGSLDCKLRLWSIPDNEVSFSKDVGDLITAVAFTPEGHVAIAGCFGGQCLFYETDGLHFKYQMHVRSSRGKNAHGAKITGIETFVQDAYTTSISTVPSQPHSLSSKSPGPTKMLISTNDSRVRLYNLQDRSLEAKFKGHENEHSQIRATFCDSGQYFISGSEDDRTYVWNASPGAKVDRKRDVQEYEYFHSSKSPVTVALFAPTLTKRILAASGDPVYLLCDPMPVKLKPADRDTSPRGRVPSNVAANTGLDDDELDDNGFPKLRPLTKRSIHLEGNIIVSADKDGTLKIFRQDCAYNQRKQLIEQSQRKQRLSSLQLSPTHSWRDSLSLGRARSKSNRSSAREQSPSLRVPGKLPSSHELGALSRYSQLSVSSAATSPFASQENLTVPPAVPPLPRMVHENGSIREMASIEEFSVGPLASSEPANDSAELSCPKCGGVEFKALLTAGVTRLVCVTCRSYM